MSTDSTATVHAPSDVLLHELDDVGVLTLTFNRPDRNNGWTIELEEAYFGSLVAAANDPAVRVIVVTGAGRSFCPGLDMLALEESARLGKPMSTARRFPMTTARLIPKPVIGAINGAAAGIGFIQMACCDVRFASTTAKFTTAFARRGLPAENSLSWLLPKIVGHANAMDLLLSARVIGAEEAHQLGLVNRTTEPGELLATAQGYARDVAINCSPFAVASIKQQTNADWEKSAEEARLTALVLVSEHGAHADFVEGVASFQEKRAPHFAGYDAGLTIPRGWYR